MARATASLDVTCGGWEVASLSPGCTNPGGSLSPGVTDPRRRQAAIGGSRIIAEGAGEPSPAPSNRRTSRGLTSRRGPRQLRAHHSWTRSTPMKRTILALGAIAVAVAGWSGDQPAPAQPAGETEWTFM